LSSRTTARSLRANTLNYKRENWSASLHDGDSQQPHFWVRYEYASIQQIFINQPLKAVIRYGVSANIRRFHWPWANASFRRAPGSTPGNGKQHQLSFCLSELFMMLKMLTPFH
jgi:hypothetical protein